MTSSSSDPGRHDPGEQELGALFAPRRPHAGHRHRGERRAGPEGQPEQQQVESGRRAVRLLHADDLAQEIAADRLGEERVAGAAHDGEEPGQHQNAQPDQAGNGLQRAKPAHRAVDDRERNDRERDEHHDQRPLQQNARAERGPEDRRHCPAAKAGRRGPALAEIRSRHRPHRRDGREQQHGVGLGEARLDAEQDRARHHQAGEQRRAARDEGERRPVGQQHRADGADERGHAIEPDLDLCLADADGLRGFDHAGLQPIDADRFLVADLVLETDIDIFARLEHLLGGLGKARLVTVDRRDLEKARQEREQRRENQHRGGASVGGHRIVDHRGQGIGRERASIPAVRSRGHFSKSRNRGGQ